jgi:hypothetical protein
MPRDAARLGMESVFIRKAGLELGEVECGGGWMRLLAAPDRHRGWPGAAFGSFSLFLGRFHHDVMGEAGSGRLATLANGNDFLLLAGFFCFQTILTSFS